MPLYHSHTLLLYNQYFVGRVPTYIVLRALNTKVGHLNETVNASIIVMS